MKLDVNSLRYLSKEEWRVLGSVELGQRNVRLATLLLAHADIADVKSCLLATAARNGAEGVDRHNSKPQVSVSV